MHRARPKLAPPPASNSKLPHSSSRPRLTLKDASRILQPARYRYQRISLMLDTISAARLESLHETVADKWTLVAVTKDGRIFRSTDVEHSEMAALRAKKLIEKCFRQRPNTQYCSMDGLFRTRDRSEERRV